MENDYEKQLNKIFLSRAFNDMMNAREKLTALHKEGIAFRITGILFLFGFLFNLSANFIYDMIKDSKAWKITISIATLCALLTLAWLTRRYFEKPIIKQKEVLDELRRMTHEAIDRAATNADQSKKS